MKKSITALTLLVGLFLCLNAWAITKTGNVSASGNMVYGNAQLLMSTSDMPGVYHTLTLQGKLTSPTGRTTGWVQNVTYSNAPNYLSVPMGLLEEYGNWRFDISYGIFCPQGRLSSVSIQSYFFTFGHSTNCFYIIPGTQQVVTTSSGKKWYALYKPAVGCSASCMVTNPYGALSPYTVGSAPDASVKFKYTWVYLNFIGQKYCLEAYEIGRNQCTAGNCGDTSGF